MQINFGKMGRHGWSEFKVRVQRAPKIFDLATLIHEVGKANCNAVTVLPRGSAHFAKLDVLLVYDSLRNHRDNHKGNHAKVGIGVQFLMTINPQQHAAGNI